MKCISKHIVLIPFLSHLILSPLAARFIRFIHAALDYLRILSKINLYLFHILEVDYYIIFLRLSPTRRQDQNKIK